MRRVSMIGLLAGLLIGCATLEQKCHTAVVNGHYRTVPECVRDQEARQQQAAQGLIDAGNVFKGINQSGSGSTGTKLDGACYSNCIGAGYAAGLCKSRCSY